MLEQEVFEGEITAQHFFPKTKKVPESLYFQAFRCPYQGIDATGFEPVTSASRTLSKAVFYGMI